MNFTETAGAIMNYETELEAHQQFIELAKSVKRVKHLFEAIGKTVPDAIIRFIGDNENSETTKFEIKPPQRPPEPSGTQADWIWVPLRALTVRCFVAGLLRVAPATAKEIVTSIKRVRHDQVEGSVYNAISALENDGIAKRGDDGNFTLCDSNKAPIIHNENAWGRKDVFQTQDVATYRRGIILHFLGSMKSGLQSKQLLDVMNGTAWITGSINKANKDVMKLDLHVLEKDKKIRCGAGKKWLLVSRELEVK